MYPWIDTWLNLFRAPLSGDVAQDYAPVTSWWSPQLEFNFAGNQKVEAEVVRQVASYGKQLGIISEALLSIAGDTNSPEIERLRVLSNQISAVKNRHVEQTAEDLKAKLERLQEQDPVALKKLLAEFAD